MFRHLTSRIAGILLGCSAIAAFAGTLSDIPALRTGQYHVGPCTFVNHPSEATACGLAWVNSSFDFGYCAQAGINWSGWPASTLGLFTGSPAGCGGGYYANFVYECPNNSYTLAGDRCLLSSTPDDAKSAGKQCGSVGNPCDPKTGNKFETDIDYQGQGSFPIVFQRSYNTLSREKGWRLGFNWRSNYDNAIRVQPGSTALAIVTRSDGRAFLYVSINGGLWATDNDLKATLSVSGSNYVYREPSGASEVYDANGRLLQVRNPAGLVQNLSYDAGGRLTQIADPDGHVVVLAYNTDGRLSSLTGPDNAIAQYSYAGQGLLARVTYPDASAKIYHYENAGFPNNLTGVSFQTPNGTITRYGTYGYDATGKAISTEHVGGMERHTLQYDSATQTTVRDALNTSEVLTYSINLGIKNLIGKVHQDGKSVTQTFDPNNNLICRKNEEGRVTTFGYNATNQKISMIEGRTGTCASPATTSATRTTTYAYLSPTLDLPTAIISPSVASGQGKTTTIGYTDATHPTLPTSITQSGFTPAGAAVSRSVILHYNAAGQVDSIDGARTDINDTTTLSYNNCTTGGSCGQLAWIKNALNQTTTFNTYDANGWVTQLTDPNGLVTRYLYDQRGRVKIITQTPPSGTARVTQYTYTPAGDVQTITFADASTLTYIYSAARLLTDITDILGNVVHYDYDLKGNRTKTTIFGAGAILERQIDEAYDARNHLQTLSAPGSLSTLVHDAIGNLTSVTDPNLNPATTNQYDALDRLFRTVDRMAGVTGYAFDVNDRLTQVVAPNNATTAYVYDDLGNLLSEASPDRGTTLYTYDNAGNLRTRTDAMGVLTQYTYDALNRLKTIDYPGTTEDMTYTYDIATNCSLGVGRLCQVQDESGVTVYAYNAFGNLVREYKTDAGTSTTYTTQYDYDVTDHVVRTVYPGPGARVVETPRNALGRVGAVNTQINGALTVTAANVMYDVEGQVKSFTYGNGISDVRTYDLQGRLKTQTQPIPIPAPDLVMTAVSTAATTIPLGASFTVANTVKNQGNANIGSSFSVRVYLSPDATITTSDTVLATRTVSSLAAGASNSANTSVTMPTVAPGTYYIGAIADSANQQTESSEGNNALVGTSVQVVNLLDITPTAISTTTTQVSVGGSLNAANSIKNQGTSATTSAFTAGFYISTDNVITASDIPVGTRSISSLAAGATSTVGTSVTVPVNTPLGNYYLGVIADTTNTQNESNETNNTRATTALFSVTSQVDLTMTVLGKSGTTVNRGTAINVNNTIQNQGSAGMTTTVQIRFYLSTDNVITPSDIPLSTRAISGLTAGATNNATTPVTIPLATPVGTYYIGAIADDGNAQSESNETNNSRATTNTVVVQ